MSNYKNDMKDCKKYSHLMSDIKDALSAQNVIYTTASENEIVITEHTSEEVSDIINSLSIPENILCMMIGIKNQGGTVYVRQLLK